MMTMMINNGPICKYYKLLYRPKCKSDNLIEDNLEIMKNQWGKIKNSRNGNLIPNPSKNQVPIP